VRDRAERVDRDRLARDILVFLQTFAESDIGNDEFGALVVALLARPRRDRLDRALAGKVECRGRKSGECEIGGTGRECFGHHAIVLIGGHRKVDALGLEVAGRRGEKQRAVIRQALRADYDALLRGGRADEAGDNEKRGEHAKNHRRTIAKQA